MPNWRGILSEVHAGRQMHDSVRRKYLKKVHKHTGRNVIAYYSGWLQKPDAPPFARMLNDADKPGFMTAIHGLDRTKGLDLILHTPGGEMAATESLVSYLHQMFDDIRAIVPQLAMSAGTMLSLACDQIVMGKHSSLGPYDPQIMGVPAQGIVQEFEDAKKQCLANPAAVPMWQVIIGKYQPTLLGQCQKAHDWAQDMVSQWLPARLLKNTATAAEVVQAVRTNLGDHDTSKGHNRHFSAEQLRTFGLPITALESDPALQDLVLSVHHAFTVTLTETASIKIIENHGGAAFVVQHRPPGSSIAG